MQVGLTGGIASGKTKFEEYFKSLGFQIYDTDKIESILRTGDTSNFENNVSDNNPLCILISQLSSRAKLSLGQALPGLYDRNGCFSRDALLSYLNNNIYGFQNHAKYNQIINPLCTEFYYAWINTIKSDSLFSSAMIVERNNLHLVEKLYIIGVSMEEQLELLIKRENERGKQISKDDALKAILRQYTTQKKYNFAVRQLGKDNVILMD